MEDYLWWKTTFGGRWSLVENELWGRMTFGGRWPSGEDNLQWKTTFGWRRPLVEDDLWWKTSFGGRRSLVEDDLRWKMIFVGKWPSGEDDLWWKMTLNLIPPLLDIFYFLGRFLIRMLFLNYHRHLSWNILHKYFGLDNWTIFNRYLWQLSKTFLDKCIRPHLRKYLL